MTFAESYEANKFC